MSFSGKRNIIAAASFYLLQLLWVFAPSPESCSQRPEHQNKLRLVSKEEQKTATEFAVSSMRIFAMKTDAKTWHLYMDPRVTDGYKKQLERYNPQYGSVNTVYQAVYTEFPPDAKKAVVRVETDAGVWVVRLQREGAGEAPKVALIEPLNLGRGH